MALFKVFRGLSTELESVPMTDGHAYFCTDDGKFLIDFINESGILERKQVNAKDLTDLQNAINTKIIDAQATDDDVVILTGTDGTNAVSYDAKHAKKGPNGVGGSAGATADATADAAGETATIKVPHAIVDAYGHTIELSEKTYTVTIPESIKNPKSLTIGNQSYDGSAAITVTAADLGLTGALVFLGTTTTNIVDASTTNPITVGGKSVTAINGNVVLYGNQEFMWNNTFWELLGDEGSYALKTVQVIAGNGLTGGGTLESNRTLNVGAGNGIVVTADAIAAKAGNGITVDSTGINHADTSSQASVIAQDRTYIKSVTLDTYGHVTSLTTGTESVVDTNQTIKVGTTTFGANDAVTLVEGSNIKITPNAINDTITFDVETAPDHVHGYTPSGSVSSTFTGTQATINSSFTPAGSVTISKGTGTANYTPAGTVSKPTFTGSATSGSTTYTPAGSVSQPTFSGTEATITITHIPNGSVSQPTFTGTAGKASATYTPAGSISKITHTPAGSITISQGTGTTNYTPVGSVSQPTFSGMQANIESSYTPAGNVSAPTITVTPKTTTVNSITAVGTLPSLTTTYTASTKNLTFGWSAGTLPTKKDSITVATGIDSAISSAPTFTGITGTATATYTPAGSVSKPTFTGTGAELKGSFSGTTFEVTPTFSGTQATIESSYTPAGTVSKPTFTGESVSGSTQYTPAGTVSKPTFSGTEATISISTTAQGTISQPTFTGTGVELKGTFTGNAGTATATYTPEGTVASTFSGTAADTTEPK